MEINKLVNLVLRIRDFIKQLLSKNKLV